MTEEIETVSKLSQERCGVPIKIGISINTGEALVGNIGFSKKMEYTVIGDVVNETFRLQELTRRKSNSILISESTYQQVKLFVYANQWRVKRFTDREEVMDIYEVMGRKDNRISGIIHSGQGVTLLMQIYTENKGRKHLH